MPFTSSLPKLVVAANKIANLPRPGRSPHKKGRLPPWDPSQCSPFDQEAISDAFFSLGNSQIPEIRRHGEGWQKLADLMKTKTVDSVSITCAWCRGENPMSSSATNQSLQVCLDTSDRDYLANWLVVEVVHLCGGTDLDAWAVKNWLFNVNKGMWPYTYFPLLPSEKDLMCAGGTPLPSSPTYLAGKFTIWEYSSPALWPLKRDATGNVTAHGTSLIDKGISYWQHSC
jgi:hypothetical protein